MEPEGYMSFLVRLWRNRSDNDEVGWRGEIEHVQSGARWSFHTLDELLGFLEQAVVAPSSQNLAFGWNLGPALYDQE